jgi:GT2 family glycosyltransferase
MNIAISILTWNRLNFTKNLINSVVQEVTDLKKDNNVTVFICDNGSNDGTKEYFNSECPIEVDVHYFKKNMGISISKNILIDKTIKNNCKYMFMFDNDVSIIPGSLKSFIKYMEKNPNTGCFGQHIDYYRREIDHKDICKAFPPIDSLHITSNVKSGCGATRAWTHYSIYRTSLFEKGVKFDSNPPLGLPGYGFDDDDLGMQIVNKGYRIDCFEDVFCYHNVNSSVVELQENIGLNFELREKYVKEKWRLDL